MFTNDKINMRKKINAQDNQIQTAHINTYTLSIFHLFYMHHFYHHQAHQIFPLNIILSK